MIASGSQNQFQSSLTPFGDLLKALMFLLNLNGFPPLHRFKGLIKGKVLLRCGRKRTLSDFITFFYLFVLVCCITCVFCFYFWVSLILCFVLFNMFLFVYFQFLVNFFKFKKNEKSEKYKNSMCFVYIGTCVPWMAIETKFSKLCIVCNLMTISMHN